MPPPPPPPPAPPPPPGPPPLPAFGNGPSSKPIDRNALLGEIRGGARLKKAKTNDRSAPAIDDNKNIRNEAPGCGPSSDGPKSNGPMAPMGLGGLFAQGMPKLKPAGSRAGSNNSSAFVPRKNESSPLFNNNQSTNAIRNGIQTHHMNGVSNAVRTPSFGGASQGRPNFPNDISANRGPPPPPPLACQKPQFNLSDSQQQHRPPFPSKPPSVTRSASQTSLNDKMGAGRGHKAPNSRPPPPPKTLGAPPALPSKPPNLSRRKSFGGPDLRNGGMLSHQASPKMNRPFHNKTSVPPPPCRNISVPDSLNQMHNQNLNGYPHEPPPPVPTLPPPPPPPPSGKLGVQGMLPGRSMPNLAPNPPIKPPNVRPPPPPSRVLGAPPPPPLPSSPAPNVAPPPPPPHHRMAFPCGVGGGYAGNMMTTTKAAAPQPPMHMNAIHNHVPPPPPTRNVSTLSRNSGGEDSFEGRFMDKFRPMDNVKPPPFGNIQKSYPSKVPSGQNRQRNPPPPPPQCNSSNQRLLHIQLGSKMFDPAMSQC